MEPTERERALDAAARALARRDLTASELAARLERRGIPPSARTEAVQTFERLGYLDDERFARDRAAALADRGLGDAGVRHDLEGRGVSSEAVDASIAALEPEQARAARQAAKLGGGLRAARSLARRGFAEESIADALASIVADDGLE